MKSLRFLPRSWFSPGIRPPPPPAECVGRWVLPYPIFPSWMPAQPSWLLKIFIVILIYFLALAATAAAAAKSLQSSLTLCDPIDGSPPGSPVPGILQARTLEWVAISFSNAWKWKVKVKSLSRVRLSATPWTAAYQGPPSMGFSRQEYWSGVPLPSPLALSHFQNLVDINSYRRL